MFFILMFSAKIQKYGEVLKCKKCLYTNKYSLQVSTAFLSLKHLVLTKCKSIMTCIIFALINV